MTLQFFYKAAVEIWSSWRKPAVACQVCVTGTRDLKSFHDLQVYRWAAGPHAQTIASLFFRAPKVVYEREFDHGLANGRVAVNGLDALAEPALIHGNQRLAGADR